MVNRASPESAEVLQQLWKANVYDASIGLALAGKSATTANTAAAPNPTPLAA